MSEETKKEETKVEEVKAEAQGAQGDAVEAKSEEGVDKKAKNAKRRPSKPKKAPSSSVDPEMEERVVAVNRVAKVVKGGRRFSFSVLMIVGDKKGRVGYGLGKAKEVPEAIRKATQSAHKHLISVPLDDGTIPHEVRGHYDAGDIRFIPAADGTGVKAAGACRSILELAGIRDVLTKSVRGNNPHNIVKATFAALKQLRSVEEIARLRGKDSKGLRTR